jgi:hypothetical protein
MIIAAAGPTCAGVAFARGSPPQDRAVGAAWPVSLDDRAHRRLAWWLAAAAIRYARDAERFYALVLLARSIICFNPLQQPP